MALGDILRITDKQVQNSQEVLNVYFYEWSAVIGPTVSDLEAVCHIYNDDVRPSLLAIQGAALGHLSTKVENLSNGVDFFELVEPTPVLGERSDSGTTLPPFVTHTFMLVRSTLDTRNGFKRFGGVSELDTAGGVSILSSTLATNMENALAADLNDGVVNVAFPVIVKRPIPAPGGVFIAHSLNGVSYRGVGTQNSRKIGRGA